MEAYKQRYADAQIVEALETFGAIVVEGARGVGKSTSATHFAASAVSLDSSPEIAALAQTSPQTVLAGAVPRLIDEWQLAPNVWNATRHSVDQRRQTGQFILTGSSSPTDEVTRHCGAGRFGRIRVRTMSLAEAGCSTEQVNFATLFSAKQRIAGINGMDVPEVTAQIVRGGWPFALNLSERQASVFMRSYLEETTRVDIGGGTDRIRVRELLRAIARNLSTETSVSNLMKEAQIPDERRGNAAELSTPTIRKYLDCLERVFIVEELPAWPTHIRSKVRQRTSPKWHFIDPSLAAAVLGINSKRLLSEPKTLGFFFESLAIRELRIYADTVRGTVSYYRDETGLEVDAIVELFDGKWAGFEVKLGGENFINAGAENLKKLRQKVSEQRQKDLTSLNVITCGNTSYTRPDGVNVIALGHLFFKPLSTSPSKGKKNARPRKTRAAT